jgi:hypothetical protein
MPISLRLVRTFGFLSVGLCGKVTGVCHVFSYGAHRRELDEMEWGTR